MQSKCKSQTKQQQFFFDYCLLINKRMSKDSQRKELADGWLLCRSKRREGRSYLFNKNTGETKWCDGSKDVQEILGKAANRIQDTNQKLNKTEPSSPPKLPKGTPIRVATKLKTPAQDRLKRLQADLKANQDKTKEKPKRGFSKTENTEISTPLPAGRYKAINPEQNQNKEQPLPAKATPKLLKDSNANVCNKEVPAKRTLPKQAEQLSPTKRTFTSISTAVVGAVYNKIKQISKTALETLTTQKPQAIASAPSKTAAAEDVNNVERKFIIPKRRLPATIVNKKSIPTEAAGLVKGAANERLKRLRKSLQQLQPVAVVQKKDLGNTNGTEPMDVEPMDWEELQLPNEESASLKTTQAAPDQQPDANTTIGDYIDNVGQNITRLAAEHANGMKKKWHTNYYYFVLDTNVWLDQLAFIKDLMQLKPCDTNGVILYIPYRVLQELDKLKQHTTREGLKTRAARAIRFLNEQFERKAIGIQAQSAIQEREHLIDITSPDDSIINCCLQIQKHISNLILLSEDVNMRNKAISNNILSSTKAELLRQQL